MPSESSGDIRERGTFADAPYMTRYYDLKFICKGSEQQFVTSMPTDRILRSEDGDSLWREGVFVAGRAPEHLPPVAVAALRECFHEMSDTGDFVIRGKGAANVCVDFVVTGVKCDLNTKVAMPHSTSSSDVHDAVRAHNVRHKVCAIFQNFIYPIAFRWYLPFLEPLKRFFQGQQVRMWAGGLVTGCTVGNLFWPKQHRDDDAGFTILVPIDYGSGVAAGGDFAFSDCGYIFGCCSGDVIIFNPSYYHGTTEFKLDGESHTRKLNFAK
ncbi:hypothetical protein AB1Y20_004512 [Prymnesium parvum]|uniref:Uncharacterized protein n=1 Tax=Prymnesium parvum TaxID=97485 RepID=A0AB34IWL9_PRYPA